MSPPSSYQLLKDIHAVTATLDKKWSKRILIVEKEQKTMNAKINTMGGKAAIGVIVLASIIGTGVSLMVDWFKSLR